MSDEKLSGGEGNGQDPEAKAAFVGEEGGKEPANPRKDLAAAGVVAVLAIVALVFAARLPNPGSLYSAPSLLPILTGASLLVMAIALAASAIRRGAMRGVGAGAISPGDATETRRTLVLIGLVVAYIIAVGLLSFDLRFPVGPVVLRLSSYEVVSVPFVAVILAVFWRASWTRCFVVSLIAVVALASIFRYVFKILLPSGG